MKTCGTCKYFKHNDHYSEGIGDCDYTLPDSIYDNHKDGIESDHANCPAHTEPEQFCEWETKTNLFGDPYVKTLCDNELYFIEEVKDVDYKFCPYCSKPIKIKENDE